MQKESIKPYYHYNCKNDAIVIDSQYRYQGDYLAVCTSNASILIYKSPIQQSILQQQDYNTVVQFNHPNKNNCYLKLAWSFYNSSILAALSISKQISYFQFDKNTLKLHKSISCQSIPCFACFLPSFDQCILSVGFSSGDIQLYNQYLECTFKVSAHKQSVNWLSWQRRLGLSQRNRWIREYFQNHVNQQLINNPPLLTSCSSDSFIKIWNYKNGELILVHSFKAHEKQIRQAMWKPNYFNNSKFRSIVSCSEDGFVKFWEIIEKSQNRFEQKMKSQRNFNGPVYRSEYNSLGNLIGISYYGGEEGKVQTRAFSDKDGILGQEIEISE